MDKKQKIGIDLDSVLARIMPEIIKFHNEVYGTNTVEEDHVSYGLYEMWNVSKEQSVDRVFEFYNSVYFDNIVPVSGSVEGVNYLAEKYDLYLITSRPTWLKKKTVDWVEKYFSGKFRKIVLTNQYSKNGESKTKSEVCVKEGIEIMIEDAVEYALDCFEKGIKVYLYNMPWNKRVDFPDEIVRISNWSEIKKHL